MSHDINRRYYAIRSIYASIKISRILPISVIDVRFENLKYQMHDKYFQNIEGLCFLLVPVKHLHLDGTGSNSSLNFDTFHFHIFTLFFFLHNKNCFTSKWVQPSCSASPISLLTCMYADRTNPRLLIETYINSIFINFFHHYTLPPGPHSARTKEYLLIV